MEARTPWTLADSRLAAYTFAVFAVASTYVICLVVDSLPDQPPPFAFFYLASFFSIIVGGRGPGLLSVALSILAYLSFFEPADRFEMKVVLPALIFAAACVGFGLINSWRSEYASVARRASRELELFLDQVQGYAIFLIDRQGSVRTWHSGAERLFGWPRGSAIGLHASTFVAGPDAERTVSEHMSIALRDGRFSDELWQKRSDGSEFLANVSISPVFDDEGKELGFAQIIFDLTERRAEEIALKRSEEHLKSILATIPEGMVVIDDRGIILAFSATAEKLFGYSQDEALGQNVDMLIASFDRGAGEAFPINSPAKGTSQIIAEYLTVDGRRSDGSIFPMRLSIGETITGAERLFTGFMQDLSEKQDYETRLSQLQNELIHVSRLSAMGTMAATMAHELNQPLTAITSYAEAAKLVVERENANLQILKQTLSELASQSLRAGEVVRKLREFVSRGDLTRTSQNLPDLIEEAVALALLGTADNGIKVRYSFDETATPVLVDRVQIQQVLINLVRNAVEAMEMSANKQIEIATELIGPHIVRVGVGDSGPGIALAIRDRIFEAFNGNKPSGMGLGLSICRTIVEAHGGKIEVVDRDGGGSLFRFTVELVSR